MAHQLERPPVWADACCDVCPAQRLGPGEFDVTEPPFPGQTFVDGVRVIAALGTPICIHPWRVGLPPGRYASAGQRLPSEPYQPADGCLMRHSDSGEHPFRVGLAPGAYASAGVAVPGVAEPQALPAPPPEALVMPEDVADLSAWMVAHLRVAGRDEMFTVVARLERQAGERFPSGEVVAILRRVLTVELTGR